MGYFGEGRNEPYKHGTYKTNSCFPFSPTAECYGVSAAVPGLLGIPPELITLQKSNIDTKNVPLLKGPGLVTGFPRLPSFWGWALQPLVNSGV